MPRGAAGAAPVRGGRGLPRPGGPPSGAGRPGHLRTIRAVPPDLTADAAPAHAGSVDADAVLREVFGYPEFRGDQRAIVDHVTSGGDALVLMPTGGGKSLCYQVPAIVRHRRGQGVAIVVSPLIALMHDQVGALEELGVNAAFLNSSLDPEEAQRIEREMMAGRLVVLYAAPERVTTPRFLAQLDSLHERGLLSLFAIDEAHCVSQWGHDFREDYLGLSVLHERWPDVPRLALTATADELTRAEIVERLQLEQARVFVASFDRPNIRYTIVERDDARAQLLRFLRDEHLRGGAVDAGIVYCASRRKVDETAEWLVGQGVPALPYHAGLDADTRRAHQDRFLREDGLVMVATIAFGMGIDKPDVRFVAHLDLPKNIEAYYQETGRAGRDGEPSNAWMVYGLADVVAQRRRIDEGEADETFKRAQRGKLDALLALAEAHDCRRVRLLAYFGEASVPCDTRWQNACDNCRQPPATWDATDAARKALSCIYRFQQAATADGGWRSPGRFGAGHLIDVLRGKATDKVRQYGHDTLSTWALGADLSETRWRGVLRQLLALGHLQAEGEHGTLALTDSARAVLRGEVSLTMRQPSDAVAGAAKRPATAGRDRAAPPDLEGAAIERFAALKAWRGEVARAHNLPAYVVFHDASLAAMARDQPASLDDLARIPGVGAKKLEAYGAELLRVLGG
jgi:ATP-dependent DNA helicase RecQ